MIGGALRRGYSYTMANDGDATSRGSAPSSDAMARARNVLPAPRSPTRCTVASGSSVRAISRPAAAVSSSVAQTNVLIRANYGSRSAGSRLSERSRGAWAGGWHDDPASRPRRSLDYARDDGYVARSL